MHVGSVPDVIILLHTELAALIKLRAADRFCEALNARWRSVAQSQISAFALLGLKWLTIIHKFHFRLYFRAFYTDSLA